MGRDFGVAASGSSVGALHAHPEDRQPDADDAHHDVQKIDNDLKSLQAADTPVTTPGVALAATVPARPALIRDPARLFVATVFDRSDDPALREQHAGA